MDLIPGMPGMPVPQMKPNQLLQQGMQALQMANKQPAGQAGLLQRLLNSPMAGPTNLAAPGMAPNAGGGGQMQMGMLSRLFPALGANMPAGNPTGGLGGLY